MAYFPESNSELRDFLPQAVVVRSEGESVWESISLLMWFGKDENLVQTATADCHS